MQISPDAAQASAPATVPDDLTPLAVILATVRWAHAAAEAARVSMVELAGNDTIDAAKAVFALRALAAKTAKAAAPYVHARLRAAPPEREGAGSHEAWLAKMERLAAEHDQRMSAQQECPADAPAVAPDTDGALHAPSASPTSAASPELQQGAVPCDARAAREAAQARADPRSSPSPPSRPRKRSSPMRDPLLN